MPSRATQAKFIEPMLLLVTETLPEGTGWSYELKLDGFRALAIKTGGDVRLRSRNDNDFNRKYAGIAKALVSLPDETVIDGEVVAVDPAGRPSFSTLQNGAAGATICYYVFDVLVLAGRNVMGEPLATRRELLTSEVLPMLAEPVREATRFDAALADLIAAVRAQGLEGLVAKRLDSVYEPGARSGAWRKMRINRSQEFVIGGYTRGGLTFDAIVIGKWDHPSAGGLPIESVSLTSPTCTLPRHPGNIRRSPQVPIQARRLAVPSRFTSIVKVNPSVLSVIRTGIVPAEYFRTLFARISRGKSPLVVHLKEIRSQLLQVRAVAIKEVAFTFLGSVPIRVDTMSNHQLRAQIMLIEDNPADVFLVKKALEANNVESDVMHFQDGDQAIRSLLSEGEDHGVQLPDLILLDLNLPCRDGLDVLHAIRSNPRLADIPVAILTSSEAPSDKNRASTIGAVHYIIKPPELASFLGEVGGAVNNLLSRRGSKTTNSR